MIFFVYRNAVDAENNNNVSTLATEVLKDLSSRVNNITVTAVVTAVLKYSLFFLFLHLIFILESYFI